jgi:hypothetical protein
LLDVIDEEKEDFFIGAAAVDRQTLAFVAKRTIAIKVDR